MQETRNLNADETVISVGHHQHDATSRTRPLQVEIKTPLGPLRGRYQVKAAVQSIAYTCLIAGYGAYHLYSSSKSSSPSSCWTTPSSGVSEYPSPEDILSRGARLLQSSNATDMDALDIEDACEGITIADPGWLCIFYAIGVLYMFLALAIVCDEFFVPALEEMSSSRRLNLSLDVAGATLMAAGGSAPELFTSLFGTFQESEVGFGTIVGSAVFNVLFVIAMCSLLAHEVLTLTWWPLFRDSLYYAVGLVVLAIFIGVTSKSQVELWEAAVLFLMYIGYCLLMWQNANLYKALTGKVLEYPRDDDDDDDDDHRKTNEQNKPSDDDDDDGDNRREILAQRGRSHSKQSVLSNLSASALDAQGIVQTPHFRWQGTFRAGILKLLKDPESWLDSAGMGIVAKIAGDADFVFHQVDKDGNGLIDRDELMQLFKLLECNIAPVEFEEVFNQLDENRNGTINQREFSNWYCRSEERILSQVRHVFEMIDVNKSNTIDAEELKTLLAMLDPHVTDNEVAAALDAMYQHGSRDEITFEEFSDWYRKSIVFDRQKKLIEEDMEGVWENLYPPKDGSWMDWTWYLVVIPLVALMTFTIPDVRRPGMGGWCYVSFLFSIGWIAGFSYFMVSWAEIIGHTIGIPSVIMGLTVLAAGTSIPDLLTSVIVARRGNGDMALSSSIGSNIFDILVGLPLPWLLFTAWPNGKKVVEIESDNIFLFLIILLGMLIFVVGSVHCQGWKLTKMLGLMFFIFYIAFLTVCIILELPFEKCE